MESQSFVNLQCPVCFETMATHHLRLSEFCDLSCNHVVCKNCLTGMNAAHLNTTPFIVKCPICRKEQDLDFEQKFWFKFTAKLTSQECQSIFEELIQKQSMKFVSHNGRFGEKILLTVNLNA